MLINHRIKMIFIHAPKCAGIAMTHWLRDHYGFGYHTNPDQMCRDSNLVERHRFNVPQEFSDYEIITCVREPFARWESFYLYSVLEMGVQLSFEQFTRERRDWLPLQVNYTRHAAFVLRVDDLNNEVKRLPFVDDLVPPIPRMNAAKYFSGYEQVKQQVKWSDELRTLVRDRFEDDFIKTGTPAARTADVP